MNKLKDQFSALFNASVYYCGIWLLALFLVFSCQLKKELIALLSGQPLKEVAGKVNGVKKNAATVHIADAAAFCNSTTQSELAKTAASGLSDQFEFTNPFIFLAFSLAGLCFLLAAANLKVLFQNAFIGSALTAKIPLFILNRQIIV